MKLLFLTYKKFSQKQILLDYKKLQMELINMARILVLDDTKEKLQHFLAQAGHESTN